eukprot:TRINITY_DN514_c1_g1_i1.p1 TRINITY_DN514_c1_g1~~TRINITY_DN514_c1_g1_i1.p1  ORF type:complete len:526 (-),score=228.66 TRINITY_DN514_c1_g1_i1:107-1684(-)
MSTTTITTSQEVIIQLDSNNNNNNNNNNNSNDDTKGFSMGLDTLVVPMSLHSKNRKRLLEFFKNEPQNSFLVFEGGKQETRHATDHEPLFRQESFFQWTFGVKEGDCYGAIHIGTGESILLIPRLPQEYAIWMGEIKSCETFKETYEVDRVIYIDEFETLFKEKDPEKIYLLKGLNSDSGNTHVPAKHKAIDEYVENKKKENDDVEVIDLDKLHDAIVECRVIKTDEELAVMKYANLISSKAHVKVMQAIEPGMMEYQLESLFRHSCYHDGGMRHQAYTCICGSGINSATLHYGHGGAPNDRLIEGNDMLLFDMGSEYHCYASDITCSYPATGKFSDIQKAIYKGVYNAQLAVYEELKPGAEWPKLHRLAERAILQNLKEEGYLYGEIDDMIDNDIGFLFQPHGLGHFLGLDTHDVGGYGTNHPKRSERPGLSSLRTARTLKPGMVVTVEPGCYFIPHLLENAFKDETKKQFLNVEKLTTMLNFGGVRLEDNIIVTEDGFENMTKCPRTIDDVERVMAGGEWTFD